MHCLVMLVNALLSFICFKCIISIKFSLTIGLHIQNSQKHLKNKHFLHAQAVINE